MADWTPVATLDDFAASDAISVDVTGREVAVYLVDGTVYATANRCTHGDASLCEGFLEGYEIECPFHQGRFDVRTGAATAPPPRSRWRPGRRASSTAGSSC